MRKSYSLTRFLVNLTTLSELYGLYSVELYNVWERNRKKRPLAKVDLLLTHETDKNTKNMQDAGFRDKIQARDLRIRCIHLVEQ
jgi:hypothetical protein